MKVEWVTTEAEWLEAATLLQQLRPQYCVEQLVRQMQKQAEAGYRLAVVRSAGRVIAVAGFVVGEKLAWGRHIYVDDLVVDEALGSKRHQAGGAGNAAREGIVDPASDPESLADQGRHQDQRAAENSKRADAGKAAASSRSSKPSSAASAASMRSSICASSGSSRCKLASCC